MDIACIQIRRITDLNWETYIHLLELNIELAKVSRVKPKLPETYGNIVCIDDYCLTIYGNLTINNEMISSSLTLMRCADCVINGNGKVIKNRWGNRDL